MPSTQLQFNSYSFSTIISSWDRRQSIVLDAAEIPRRDGQVIQGSKQGIREYLLKGAFQGNSAQEVRTLYDSMMGSIVGVTANLYLLDDRFVECRLVDYNDTYVEGGALTVLEFELTFQSTLPYEQSATLSSGNYTTTTIENEYFVVNHLGNYPAYTKITVTAPGTAIAADCSIGNLTTDDYFSYLGTIAAGKDLVINNMVVPFTVLNNGTSDLGSYSGALIKLNPGNNTIKVNSAIGAQVLLNWRDTYV